MKELSLIRFIRDRTETGPNVVKGIGDDAAVIRAPEGGIYVVTTDLLVEGTHFLQTDDPGDVGWKSLAVSISDVAAMGCRATTAVLSAGLDRARGRDYAEALLEGARRVAEQFGVSLVGGDTTESKAGVVLCGTVIGEPPPGRSPVLRSAAVPGHSLLVTGNLGGSLAGRHLTFRPRQPEALALVAEFGPSAMIDVSDGLSTDAGHLARESGVGIRLYRDRLPLSPSALAAPDPVRSALDDGEDFELLFTLPETEAAQVERSGLVGTPVRVIGQVFEGTPGVVIADPDGTEEDVREGGYEHFR